MTRQHRAPFGYIAGGTPGYVPRHAADVCAWEVSDHAGVVVAECVLPPGHFTRGVDHRIEYAAAPTLPGVVCGNVHDFAPFAPPRTCGREPGHPGFHTDAPDINAYGGEPTRPGAWTWAPDPPEADPAPPSIAAAHDWFASRLLAEERIAGAIAARLAFGVLGAEPPFRVSTD